MSTGLIASAPTFQTGDSRYQWLNKIQAIGAGQFDSETGILVYQLYEVRIVAHAGEPGHTDGLDLADRMK